MRNHCECIDLWQEWTEKATADTDLRQELLSLSGQSDELEDRFYRELEFGTGGLRGILGAGTNRMNVYVVARATQGVCRYLREAALPQEAAISYDSRLKSRLFAETAAGVFAANGVRVHFTPYLMPAPFLSFATRHFGCGVGIMITASHNGAEYNGYKVYGPDGCQITAGMAESIQRCLRETDMFGGVRSLPFAEAQRSGLTELMGGDVADAYLAALHRESLYEGGVRTMPIVYTPLNGAGINCVPRCLRESGFTQVILPPSQAAPDGRFPTCPQPNPEKPEALSVAVETARAAEAGLVLATDPDCDRIGVAVRSGRDYTLLSGNQTGVLLLDFLCRRRQEKGTLPAQPLAVKTIVTTPMADAVAAHYGVEIQNTLTGFKYIGALLGELEGRGELNRFIFGFEESYGYLTTTAVRDKDAVNAAGLIAEMYVWYRQQKLTLLDALERLYETYGYYEERLLTFSFPGAAGAERMERVMERVRHSPPTVLGGLRVEENIDYLRQETGLPRSNVLQCRLQGGTLATIRPSGTEPKLKIYLAARDRDRGACAETLRRLEEQFSILAGQEERPGRKL